MSSSERQREDINRGIAEYLQMTGYTETFSMFLKEASLSENDIKIGAGILEKKWTTVLRLQRKVNDLEAKLAEVQSEIAHGAPTRDKRQAADWIPRPPETQKLIGHRLPITRVIFHPLWSVMASCSEDATIRIWDYESGQLERSLKGHTDAVNDIAFDVGGKQLVSCSTDLTIKVWDFGQTYDCLKSLKGHEHTVSSVTFVPNGDFVLSASRDHTIKMWDISTGYSVFTFRGHNDWVRMVRVSPDGTLFATASNDQTVRIWSISTKSEKLVLRDHEHAVECIEWAPDTAYEHVIGKQPEIGSSTHILFSGSRDRTIKAWNISTGDVIFTLQAHENWLRGLAFHPKGKFLISVADDKTLRIWELAQQRCMKTIEAHDHFVSAVAFHQSAPYVITGSVDLSCKVWECR